MMLLLMAGVAFGTTINLGNGGQFTYYNSTYFVNGTDWVYLNCSYSAKVNYTIKPSQSWTVDCGSCPAGKNCTLPQENLTLTQSTTLYGGIYNFYDSDVDGALKIGANNIVLDCNGASLVGNGSSGSIGINFLSGKINTTIKNCKIQDYADLVILTQANTTIFNNTFNNTRTSMPLTSKGITIINNTFYQTFDSYILYSNSGSDNIIKGNTVYGDNKYDKSFVFLATNSKNFIIENNIIYRFRAFLVSGIGNHVFIGNTVKYINSTPSYSIRFANVNNITYIDNVHLDGHNYLSLYNISNSIFANNTFYNTTYISWFSIDEYSNNLIIDNNSFAISDRAIQIIGNSRNINITNNYISDLITNVDSYSVAIDVYENVTNLLIDNNYINYGIEGILLRNCSQVIITNNEFNQMSLHERWLYGIEDAGEPSCAICLTPTYKGYFHDGDTSAITIQRYTNYAPHNITISGNTFDSDVQTYMRVQSAQNVIHDLSNYWYRSIAFDSSNIPKMEFYNSNLWNKLISMEGHYASRPTCFDSECKLDMFVFLNKINTGSSPYNTYKKFNYTISKTLMTFKNINLTTAYNLSLYNLTDQPDSRYVQVFNGTSPTPQYQNTNRCNMTIGANERVFVFSQSTATEPHPTSIATTITSYTTTYVEGTSYTVDCTGTGSHAAANLDDIGATIDVYHNNKFVEQIQAATYTMSGCSSWSFRKYTGTTLSNTSGAEHNLLFMLIWLIALGSIYAIFTTSGWALILVIIGATVAIAILQSLI